MKKLIIVLGFFLIFTGSGSAQSIDDMILMSEDFPPYNYIENGDLKGTSIDLMALILQRMHSKKTRKDIEILPWARSYMRLKNEKNTVLFAMTRTPERENLFKWVGPISSAKNVLMAKKDRKIKINSIDDAKTYYIGAIRDDAGEQLVLKAGASKEQLDIASNAELCIRKFAMNRFDLLAYDENVSKWIMQKIGLEPADYETVYVLQEGFHYFGFNKDTPDALIKEMQNVLDGIKKEGEYQKIMNRYIK